jgi:leader peptidase (prepilin peptidase)/N-methyltransferase
LNSRRFSRRIPLFVSLTILVAGAAAYVLGMAWLQSRFDRFSDFEDLLVPRLVDVTVVAWLLYFGGAIGSFLNVVAWRMPRGDSMSGRSHCPRCASTLKARDNVPVLGWLALGGRCRTCRLPISARYPIVEAVVAISLTVVGVTQLYSLALPGQSLHSHGGPMYAPRVTAEILAILTYHAVALSAAWAVALIRIDGARLPKHLIAFAAAALLLPMLAYPALMVVAWQTERPANWSPHGLYFHAVMRVATALVAAAFYGRVLAKGLCPQADLKLDPLGSGTARLVDLIVMLSIPAVLIGWQSMAGFVILAALLSCFVRPLLAVIPINDTPRGQIERRGVLERFAFAIPIALTIYLAAWRLFWNWDYWPSDRAVGAPGSGGASGNRVVIIVWALAVLFVPAWLRTRPPQAVESSPAEEPSPEDEAPQA